MQKENSKKISYHMLQVFKKISDIDEKTRKYGTDEALYPSELHIIKAIKENEGLHITALADKLSITKGAVSQTLIKLQRKGMIVKEPDSTNQSRIFLRLSEKGEIAYQNHEKLHADFDNVINGILGNETEEHKKFIHEFLKRLDQALDNYSED